MTPSQFIKEVESRGPQPVYLFTGPEMYERGRCRAALLKRHLASEDREQAFTRHELNEVSLAYVFDDASSFSLFASKRVIWVAGAEVAASTRRGSDEGEEAAAGDGLLDQYLKNPAPGVVIVFDVSRFELTGDDKARLERVRKFFTGAAIVEFARLDPEGALSIALTMAAGAGVALDAAAADLLVEACDSDALRLSLEIEKLALLAPEGRVTVDQVESLVLNARTNSIFELVASIGRRDRAAALAILDALVREGEYLPLALSFLGTQLRMALAASDAGLRSASQVQGHFQKAGVQMWRSRAEQVAQTVAAFPRQKLEQAIGAIYEADRGLRDTNPDERIVIERFILNVTS